MAPARPRPRLCKRLLTERGAAQQEMQRQGLQDAASRAVTKAYKVRYTVDFVGP